MPVFITGGTGFLGRRIVRSLSAEGQSVHALSRSPAADRLLAALGALPVRGDLDHLPDLPPGAAIIHAAAHFRMTGPRADFDRVNVAGTRRLLDAARRAGAPAFLHIGAAAVVMDDAGSHVTCADETAAVFPDSRLPYIASKARGEAAVIAAAAPGFRTLVLRPPAIWGPGDVFSRALPEALARRRFGFIGGGEFAYVTCHADNVVEALRAALRGAATGRAYFVNDREPTTFRAFVMTLAAALGHDAARAPSLPYPVARVLGGAMARFWAVMGWPGDPPLSPTLVRLIGRPFTTDDRAIRRDLGYVGRVTRAEGLADYLADGPEVTGAAA